MWLALTKEFMSCLSDGSIKSQWAIFLADCHNSGRLWGRHCTITINLNLKSHVKGTVLTKGSEAVYQVTNSLLKVSSTHLATRPEAGPTCIIYRLVSVSFTGGITNELDPEWFTNCWGKMLTMIELLSFSK